MGIVSKCRCAVGSAVDYIGGLFQESKQEVVDCVQRVDVERIGSRVTSSKSTVIAFSFLTAFALAFFGEYARAEVTLPTMPIDFAEYAAAGMVVVGTVLGSIAGIIVVVKLVQVGLRKLGNAFSGRA
jgi:hypothetical protein